MRHIALALLLALAGCATPHVRPIADEAEFNALLADADAPVVVCFYKGGVCPPCNLMLALMDRLALEYGGRVAFAGFELMTPGFAVTAPDLKARLRLDAIPVAVLFVEGEERHRWSMWDGPESYVRVLDALVGPACRDGTCALPATEAEAPGPNEPGHE